MDGFLGVRRAAGGLLGAPARCLRLGGGPARRRGPPAARGPALAPLAVLLAAPALAFGPFTGPAPAAAIAPFGAPQSSDAAGPAPHRGTLYLDPEDRFLNLVLPEERYEMLRSEDAGWTRATYEQLAQRVLEEFEDEFEFIFFAFDDDAPRQGSAAGVHYRARSSATGLGLPDVDVGQRFGSAETLLGTIVLSRHAGLAGGPSLHEILHAWGQAMIYTEARGHWGFAGVGGQLGGWEPGRIESLEAGRYQARFGERASFGLVANGGNALPYAPLELYLMGLLPADSVPDFERAVGAQWVDPRRGIFVADGLRPIAVGDLLEEHGERTPAYPNAPTHFRALYILMTSAPLEAERWAEISEEVRLFSQAEPNGSDRLFNFWEATGGRATLGMDGLAALHRGGEILIGGR